VDVQTPLEEMLRALDDLVHQGKVRCIACSNYEAWRLSEALCISETENLARFECYQPQYSLVVRDIEEELIPLCQHKGLGVAVWSPLAGGFLTGKYKPGQRELAGTRSEEGWVFPRRYMAANADETLQVLLDVAQELGRTPAQVAVRWVLEQPAITSTIVGARTAEQLRDSLGAAQWRLEGDALKRLDEVSRLPERYPKSMEKAMEERRDKAIEMPSL
jgi:aryl-alcohol dehydrogenase-like predicted oxidoreductase